MIKTSTVLPFIFGKKIHFLLPELGGRGRKFFSYLLQNIAPDRAWGISQILYVVHNKSPSISRALL